MDFVFTGKQEAKADVPFFEDARAKETKYYASTKSLAMAQREVRQELQALDCYKINFAEGHFGVEPKRYGYLVTFGWNGAQGKIPLAGLPLRGRYYADQLQKKIERLRVQALLILRDQLISYRQSPVFLVDTMPLLQHILVDGKRTVGEYVMQLGTLPALPSGVRSDVVEGEFVEG